MPKTFNIPAAYRSDLVSALKRRDGQAAIAESETAPVVFNLGPLRLKVARSFGFCFGVQNAIQTAYQALAENSDRRVFLLSEMIHNPQVNNDLREQGVRFIVSPTGRNLVPLEELTPVVTSEELLQMQAECRQVHVAADVEDYIIRLIHATREHEAFQLGASPRAMLALYRAAQAMAALRGRAFVVPDDVKYLVPYVLVHRIISRAESHLRGHTVEKALQDVMDSVPVPVEEEVS